MARKNRHGAEGGYAKLANTIMDGPKMHSETVNIGDDHYGRPLIQVEYDGFRDLYALQVECLGVVQTRIKVYLSSAQFNRLQQAMTSVRTRGEGERERLLRKKAALTGR